MFQINHNILSHVWNTKIASKASQGVKLLSKLNLAIGKYEPKDTSLLAFAYVKSYNDQVTYFHMIE
jgi:hypothetical protein